MRKKIKKNINISRMEKLTGRRKKEKGKNKKYENHSFGMSISRIGKQTKRKQREKEK